MFCIRRIQRRALCSRWYSTILPSISMGLSCTSVPNSWSTVPPSCSTSLHRYNSPNRTVVSSRIESIQHFYPVPCSSHAWVHAPLHSGDFGFKEAHSTSWWSNDSRSMMKPKAGRVFFKTWCMSQESPTSPRMETNSKEKRCRWVVSPKKGHRREKNTAVSRERKVFPSILVQLTGDSAYQESTRARASTSSPITHSTATGSQ